MATKRKNTILNKYTHLKSDFMISIGTVNVVIIIEVTGSISSRTDSVFSSFIGKLTFGNYTIMKYVVCVERSGLSTPIAFFHYSQNDLLDENTDRRKR